MSGSAHILTLFAVVSFFSTCLGEVNEHSFRLGQVLPSDGLLGQVQQNATLFQEPESLDVDPLKHKSILPEVGHSSTVTIWLLITVALLANVSPWLWIGFRDNIKASAWGTKSFLNGGTPVSAGEKHKGEKSARGENTEANSIWIPIAITYMVAVSILYLIKEPERWSELLTGYVLSFLLAFAILMYAYKRFGHAAGKSENDVSGALMMNFFIFGGLLGICFTITFQSVEQSLFSKAVPSCSMIYLNRDPVMREPSILKPLTPWCSVVSAIMWILVEGLVEETGKAMWLFWRLRRHERDMPRNCFFNQCSTLSGADCCGGFFKLAPSPRHVLLCALACGAGYQCLENVKYGFHRTPLPEGFAARHHFAGVHPSLLMVSFFTFLSSALHIVWTGLIGAGLATHMFGHPHERPSLIATVLPSIVFHGVFDWGLASLHNLAMRTEMNVMETDSDTHMRWAFLSTIVTCFGASCCLLYRRVKNLPKDTDTNVSLL